MIDFHTHILPGVDDGSQSVEESLTLLQMEAEQGITRVVATPHFYPGRDDPERFLRRREKAEKALRQAMAGRGDLPQISIGAEVYYFSGISDSELISELTIDQKRCILIEMPNVSWTDSMYRELEGLYAKRDLLPVIAHVDRYLSFGSNARMLERLAELPLLVQANANFFLKWATSRKALHMLQDGRIHLLGSDCHDCSDRKPNLGAAWEVIRKRLGEHALNRIETYEQKAMYHR